MSLYYEAARVLTNSDSQSGSLKSRVYGNKDLKSSPAQLFGLLTEATKWSAVLKDVIEKSGILQLEKKLSPQIALLLSYDLLLSKGGIAASVNHPIRLPIKRHKARLRAELTKLRIKYGFSTVDALRTAVNTGTLPIPLSRVAEGSSDMKSVLNSQRPSYLHPRWVRINTLRTTLEAQLSSTFATYARADNLRDITNSPPSPANLILHIDRHIPNLIALPPNTDLSSTQAYKTGALIIQDKASCFPALLLDPRPTDGSIIDACAAPGNKTTHLAALAASSKGHSPSEPARFHRDAKPHIVAFERDVERSQTLRAMIDRASAQEYVSVRAGTDFLAVDPLNPAFADVGALLLDPSCSGSGMVGRDDGDGGYGSAVLVLPDARARDDVQGIGRMAKTTKRRQRRSGNDAVKNVRVGGVAADKGDSDARLSADDLGGRKMNKFEEDVARRLAALSAFQVALVKHAMAFPAGRKIVYSTCSEHWIENEGVVRRVLTSNVASDNGWRVLRRDEQVEALARWERRGWKRKRIVEGAELGEETEELDSETANACIRCKKRTDEGTMGFFVVGFVRDTIGGTDIYIGRRGNVSGSEHEELASGQSDEDEIGHDAEWKGFSDEDETVK